MAQAYSKERGRASATDNTSAPPLSMVSDRLEQVVQEGAERLLTEMLELQVAEFLERLRYQRSEVFKGYRNDYAPERTIGVGLGSLRVRVPRVSDVPAEVEPDGFRAQIVGRYQRISRTTQHLLAQLYLEGLSTGDFAPVFRALLGESSPLSPSSVTRLRQEWQAEFDAWRTHRLDEHRYLYLWVDGVYLRAGQEADKTALLCVLGLREDGEKELLAMVPGYRESTESWADVLRDLKERGLQRPMLVIGDGALGIWAALGEVWPEARRQRCWNHRALNVLNKLPKGLWKQVRNDLRDAAQAETRQECRQRLQAIAAALRKIGQAAAAETVLRDMEDFMTFYDFPQGHWLQLRTTNPIESIFAGVRLRTNVTKRMPNRENAVYLVFKIVQRLSQHWRRVGGGNLCRLVLEGKRFVNGKLIELTAT